MTIREIVSGQTQLTGLAEDIISLIPTEVTRIYSLHFDINEWSAANPLATIDLIKSYAVQSGQNRDSNPIRKVAGVHEDLVVFNTHEGDEEVVWKVVVSSQSGEFIKYRYVKYTEIDNAIPFNGFITLDDENIIYLEFTPTEWEKIDGLHLDINEWKSAHVGESLHIWKEVKVDGQNYRKLDKRTILADEDADLYELTKHEGDEDVRFAFQQGSIDDIISEQISPIYIVETTGNPSVKDTKEINRGAVIDIKADQAGDIVTIYVNRNIPQNFDFWVNNPITVQAKQTVGGTSATIDLEVFDTLQDNEDDRGNFGGAQSLTGVWADYVVPTITAGTWNRGYPFKVKITIVLTDVDDEVRIGLRTMDYDIFIFASEKIYYRYVRYQN